MSYRPRLFVMAREPRLGRVKSRLAKSIGRVSALRVYRVVMGRTFKELSGPEDWDRIALVTPDHAALGPAFWPSGWRPLPQGSGDLGMRMTRPMVAAAPGPVILVGTDIPGLTKAHIKSAFRLLKTNDAVFGPAVDGGFWLLGFKRLRPIPRSLFSGVAWSQADTLKQAVASIPGLSVGYVQTLDDLDEAKDLDASLRRL